MKEPVLTWNCSSKKLQRTSSRSYPETTGSLKIFKNMEPAVTLKFEIKPGTGVHCFQNLKN